MQHVLLVILAAAACGGGTSSAPVGNTAPGPLASRGVVLQDLQNGDRACYVVLANGKSLEGDFELCKGGSRDATALIGKPVTYTTKKANVLAVSCQGDVDCGTSDEVDLVVTLSAAAP